MRQPDRTAEFNLDRSVPARRWIAGTTGSAPRSTASMSWTEFLSRTKSPITRTGERRGGRPGSSSRGVGAVPAAGIRSPRPGRRARRHAGLGAGRARRARVRGSGRNARFVTSVWVRRRDLRRRPLRGDPSRTRGSGQPGGHHRPRNAPSQGRALSDHRDEKSARDATANRPRDAGKPDLLRRKRLVCRGFPASRVTPSRAMGGPTRRSRGAGNLVWAGLGASQQRDRRESRSIPSS